MTAAERLFEDCGPTPLPPDDGGDAREYEFAEVASLVTPLPDSLVDPARWKLVVARPWRFADTIHIKEARTAVLALRRASRSRELHGTRVLGLGDNLSEICAVERGRTSHDPRLRRVLLGACAQTFA